MKLDGIDIDGTIKQVELLLETEKDLSPALKTMLPMLLLVVKLLTNRLGLTSSNSSKPPSSDPNREKTPRKKTGKKPGGQKNHVGSTLKQIDEPDEIEVLLIDRRTLPKNHQYKEIGYQKRQVFDMVVSREVTEYQLLPYNRIQEYFSDQLQIPLSQGSLYRFNVEAFKKLALFEKLSKEQLMQSKRIHADETGINIDSKRHWLHCASNDEWTYFYAHKKRGCEAMDDMNILPHFKGVLCHDHWKPYYQYDNCLHALCNAHHIRELTRAHEQDGQQWADNMKALLEEVNEAVHKAGQSLKSSDADNYWSRYRQILNEADIECPPPDESQRAGKRGRLKRSKARNLLERLRDYESDVLRFMENPDVPFTNNLGENDIRMTKVQQKISGCFRSMEGAQIFCRVRGYLSTCKKQGVGSSYAMDMLFEEKLPDFCVADSEIR